MSIAIFGLAAGATPDAVRADAMLGGFDYGWPVKRHSFISQGAAMEMAYLDVPAAHPNGRTAVLLHGKNFCAGAWQGTIRALTAAGYRVIAPDQIGFCKSTKPERYQYGFHTLAANSKALLDALGVEKPIVIGHSMGGMLAIRYALQYPAGVSKLVLVNPIGLEDWRAKGVPNATVDQLFAGERKTNAATIRAYQQRTYYAGSWRPDYDRWVEMLASMYAGADGTTIAWHQALTSDMVFNQPVVHELERIEAPTALIIGEKDNTAIGKDRADKALAATLGDYPVLARDAAKRIPGAALITYPDLGHAPQIQAPDRFHRDLLLALAR
ncbi:pimeloyl-ACP methyl ester carboxylesterase [Sphingomonas zeicaulis]|uniref:alpha/beta fold hydrolase n=1 Tax=Sphingomonas zeicaulis TaxID=1632740 RepID=UPI003D1BB5CE